MKGKERLLFEQLDERLLKNLTDYHKHLLGLSQRDIIEISDRVSATSDAYAYLTNKHVFNIGQLEYLLQFQNPLEIVADAWLVQREDKADLSFILASVCERSDALQLGYARFDEAAPEQEDKVAKENRPFGIPTMQNGRKVLADKLDECLLAHFAALQADKQGNIPGLYALSTDVDVHYHMKVEHEYAPAEIETLLRFKDPLEVASRAWEENTHAYSFPICEILKEMDAFAVFPQVEPAPVEKKKSASVRARLAVAAKEVKARPDADSPQKGKKEHGRE